MSLDSFDVLLVIQTFIFPLSNGAIVLVLHSEERMTRLLAYYLWNFVHDFKSKRGDFASEQALYAWN